MKISIDRNNIVGLIFFLFALSDILQSIELIVAGTILSIITFSLYFQLNKVSFLMEFALFILFMLFTSLVNLFFTNNAFGGSIVIIGNLFLSFIYFHANHKILTKWILMSFSVTICFVIYKLFVLKVPGNEIYEGLSRNHAGFVIIFWTVFLLFHLRITYNKLPIVLPLVSLILSILLIGRTSIIVSTMLLLIVFFFKFKDRGVLPFIIALLFLISFSYYVISQYGTIIFFETNLQEGIESSRWEIWRAYLDNINFLSFFTGVDVSRVPLIHQYGDNPHNSFLKFHSRFGFGSIVFIIFYFISIIKYLKKKNIFILGLLLLLTIRAFFDSDILVGNFDFIFFIITFYCINFNKHEHEHEHETQILHNNSFIQ